MFNDNKEVCKIRLSEKRKILHPSKFIPVMHSETSSAEKGIKFEEQSEKEKFQKHLERYFDNNMHRADEKVV